MDDKTLLEFHRYTDGKSHWDVDIAPRDLCRVDHEVSLSFKVSLEKIHKLHGFDYFMIGS